MKRYTVKWGDETKTVFADSEQDAWAGFADGNDLAKRHPKSRERKIEEATEPPADTKPAATRRVFAETGKK